MPNLRYYYKHKKISPNMWFGVVPRHIFVDPNIEFSYNSPDSKIVGSPDICLGTNQNHIFGEFFLCFSDIAKTQENFFLCF